jgi:sugar fermentation stimulation protein A
VVAIAGPRRNGVFLQRLNRFAALVEVDGRQELAHVPNSGRLKELFQPGMRVVLTEHPDPFRKCPYDLVMVRLSHTLVSMDARLPSRLFQEALEERWLLPFLPFPHVQREVRYEESRLDFCLTNGLRFYLEVKSITLVIDEVALFPDAPTERGSRHLRTLMQAKEEGHRAGVVFVIQRDDAASFSSNDDADPLFGRTLRQAASEGVEVYAYCCMVNPEEVRLVRELPVRL